MAGIVALMQLPPSDAGARSDGRAGEQPDEGVAAVTDPGTMVERRCAVLVILAEQEEAQGHTSEARELFAAALCEARRSDRADLLSEVRGACARADRTHPVRRLSAFA
jgi:hypothetical protein